MPRYARSDARRWVRENLRGYFTVLYTPFLPDGEIDEAGLRRNVAATLALPGVGGLSVHSIHQEFWTLTDAERKRVTEIVIETVDGKALVVVGASDPSARTVVDLAKHAQAAGADAVMVWPPYYGPRTQEGVRAFYEYVAERIDIGMIAYSTTLSELGYYLAPDQVAALLQIEHLCAVQNTTLDFSSYAAMMERVGDRICVTTSLEEYFLFGKLAFADGRAPDFLLGSSRPLFVQNAAQPRCGRFIEAVQAKDYRAAAEEVRAIVALAGKLQSRYFARGFHHIALSKALTGLFGMATGGTRPPLGEATPAELAECAEILASAGLIEPRAS
jgi:4-hydroxy-tetrahydrodipicolinate synthase